MTGPSTSTTTTTTTTTTNTTTTNTATATSGGSSGSSGSTGAMQSCTTTVTDVSGGLFQGSETFPCQAIALVTSAGTAFAVNIFLPDGGSTSGAIQFTVADATTVASVPGSYSTGNVEGYDFGLQLWADGVGLVYAHSHSDTFSATITNVGPLTGQIDTPQYYIGGTASATVTGIAECCSNPQTNPCCLSESFQVQATFSD